MKHFKHTKSMFPYPVKNVGLERLILTIGMILIMTQIVLGNVISWGDQGNGEYINPVLNADYSDPDVIRVGDKFYMVCSDFHFIGMPVLESSDMVNWTIISQVYDKFDYPGWNEFKHYAGGSWAPAIRYHDGMYYVYFCTPDEGLFMSSSKDPHGPWSELHLVKEVKKWEDPCPFWDEDGRAYLVRSQYGAGPIFLHRMTPDGKELIDDGVIIYEGEVAEGPKLHKFDGKYYISLPEGGVREGWQSVLRSDSIYGPYERKVVLETGTTDINGPHQGAIVDNTEGSWWFFHFQEVPKLGRVVHLQPMEWHDGWPYIGVDYDGNGVGEPVKVWNKPIVVGKNCKPQSSDSFDGPKLGLQWQANHMFIPENISFSEKEGWLSLTAAKGDSLKNAPNTLTQKLTGYQGTAIVRMDISDMKDGQSAGMACLSKVYRGMGITRKDSMNWIYVEVGGERKEILPIEADIIHLKADFDVSNNKHSLSYSLDGETYILTCEPFEMRWGDWKGPRVGLYSYGRNGGIAHFDEFLYNYD